jgi:predicted GIY-YIG superfamily endonuclease
MAAVDGVHDPPEEQETPSSRFRTQEYVCYLLVTRGPRGGLKPYVGVTFDMRQRLRKHNGIVTGGAKRTHRLARATNGDVSKCALRCVAVARGFPTYQIAQQFEWIATIKRLNTASRLKKTTAELKTHPYKTVTGEELHDVVRGFLQALNCTQWTAASPPASTVPLVVEWWLPEYKPDIQASEGTPYLPPYITEAVHPAGYQDTLLAFTPRELLHAQRRPTGFVAKPQYTRKRTCRRRTARS